MTHKKKYKQNFCLLNEKKSMYFNLIILFVLFKLRYTRKTAKML